MSVCPSVYIFEIEEEEEEEKKKKKKKMMMMMICVRALPGTMHLGLKRGPLCPII